MEDRDVTFSQRKKIYIANASDWVVDDEDRVQELYNGLSLITTVERECMYTRKDVRKALEEGEFLRALGYLPYGKESPEFCTRRKRYEYSIQCGRR